VHESRSDTDLVSAANRGDNDALADLYLRYRDWATSLAHRFTGDRDAALDVMQESFLYFFAKFPGFRLRAKLTTFLYPVIKNNALAARRKKRPEAADDESLAAFPAPVDAGPSPPELTAAVARLPDPQREVLLMRALDEMSVTEIALALGIPEGTVKSRMHHAIATLRTEPQLRSYWQDVS
jgi:RNA polymerase sigma-70 factor, ECF subfamily